MSEATVSKPMHKYRLMYGGHEERETVGVDERGIPIKKSKKFKVDYKTGERPIIETHRELDKMFNVPDYPAKFERVASDGDSQAVFPIGPPARDEFDNMTVAQLREFAEQEELDVSGLARKAEIIKAIRSHVPARS